MDESGRVVGAATDDETAELVVPEVVLSLLYGLVEIERGRFLDLKVKIGAEDERCRAGVEGGRDGP